MSHHASTRGVYSIAVAAELVGLGEQTLRLYERKGLLLPARTPAGTRRYSDLDLEILRRVAELIGAGLNLAGIAMVLELEASNDALRAQLVRSNSSARRPQPLEAKSPAGWTES